MSDAETPPVRRRTVLKHTAALGAISVTPIPVAGQEEKTFYLEQGDQCWEVDPLSYKEEDIVDYYGFNNAHAHPSTDILESDTSHLFLYEDPNGIMNLVMVHDIPSHGNHGSAVDTGGGRVSFEFTGLPDDGSWVVKDDVGDPIDTFSQTLGEWSWGEANTDGGAYGGLGSDFDVEIDPTFNDESLEVRNPGEISFWCFLSGDAEDPDEVLLDMETPARVLQSSEAPCEEPITDLPDECVHEINLDIKPCSDPNAINPDSKGVIPVGIAGETDFDVRDIVVDSLRFGAIGHVEAEPAHMGHYEDTVPCEGDTIEDLVVHFPTEDTGFEKGDELGKLIGRLKDGSAIIGFDSVKIVGGGGPGGP